jgi:hypothetical protein
MLTAFRSNARREQRLYGPHRFKARDTKKPQRNVSAGRLTDKHPWGCSGCDESFRGKGKEEGGGGAKSDKEESERPLIVETPTSLPTHFLK